MKISVDFQIEVTTNLPDSADRLDLPDSAEGWTSLIALIGWTFLIALTGWTFHRQEDKDSIQL